MKLAQEWSKLRGDPGGEAYANSVWATKTYEREVDKQMPLLSEFLGYREWGARPRDGQRCGIIAPEA